MKSCTIQDKHIKCDFVTRPSQNSKQIASVPPTNNNNSVQLKLTSWQFGWKVRNAHIFTSIYNHKTKYHTWYIYKPDWYTVLLCEDLMIAICDWWCFWGVPFTLNVSSSQYQINKFNIGKILSSWWPQYDIHILRFKLQLRFFPLPSHLIMNRLMIGHWYRIYNCDNEREISNQMAFST